MTCSIRTRLILAIGLPLLAVYLVMLAAELRLGKKEAIARAERYLTVVTEGNARAMDVQFSTAAQVARTTAALLALVPDLKTEQIETVLRKNVADNDDIFGMCMAFEPEQFASGSRFHAPYVCRQAHSTALRTTHIQPGNGYDYTVSDWFLVPKLLGRPAWTDAYFDKGAGNALMCTYSVPFYHYGRFAGVVTVDVAVEHIRRALSKIEDGYCSILGATGTFISDPHDTWVMKETLFSLAESYHFPELAQLGHEVTAGESGTRRLIDPRTGQPMWVAFAPLHTTGWSLLAAIPEDTVMAPVYRRLAMALGILAAGLLLIAGIIVAVSIRITRPIGRLARVTQELSGGNLDAHVTGVAGGDEIAQLAGTFNKMIVDLKANVESRIREESARRAVEGELTVAREIQASLLPRKFPPFSDRREFDLHAINAPAKFIAGDFYDFFFVDRDTLAVVMADVSGKGAPAAMFMAVARTAIRNFTVPGKSPAQILKHVNDVMVKDNDNGMFVTVFYGLYNVRTGDLTFANAGHNPPYALGPGGTLATLEPTGPLLAVLDEAEYADGHARIEPGGVLVLFTDGVTEAQQDREMYGTKRFEQLLLSIAGLKVEDICQGILDTVIGFGGPALTDDVTLLALRRNA